MAPELQRPLPPYLQIAEHYRDLIRRGELRDGDRLPSTRQLVEQWRVAHATAARVLSTLRAEGLVTTTPGGGGGTIVNVQDLGYAPRDRMLAVRQWSRVCPPGEHARIVSAELVEAPEHVAEAMGVQPGAPVIRRHRITYRGKTPVSASTSWFVGALAEVAPDLLRTERIREGTAGYVERQAGRVIRYGRDQLAAGTADARLAADLAVPEGTPVLVGRNWVRDVDGDLVEYGEYVSVPDRWQTYGYELG